MSGINERKQMLVKSPVMRMYPDFWRGEDERGNTVCWLVQKIPRRKKDKDVDLIVIKKEFAESDIDKITGIASIVPYGFHYKESDEFFDLVKSLMRRAFKRQRWVQRDEWY